MRPNFTRVGCIIRSKRRRLGISQEELAHRSKIDRTYVSEIERNIKTPSVTIFIRIAIGLESDPGNLINELQQKESERQAP